MRLCAVSVDLDEIPNYFAIHGLPGAPAAARTLVYDVALDRLAALARDLSIPLTLFAVGADLARAASATKLRAARESGFEIANHSFDHRYDLVRLGRAEIRRQIEEGASAIAAATGVRPVGFRAPGYTITDAVFDVLEELGIAYDSSVFPCPSYWAAKAAAIALIAARGRASRSILDTPSVLRAPTRPYAVGRPYWRGRTGASPTAEGSLAGRHSAAAVDGGGGVRRSIVEMPIQVTRTARLPVIGTFLTLWGRRIALALTRGCIGEPFVNLELHGIDVLDADDGLQALRAHQRDVRVPWREKVACLRAAIELLRSEGYAFVTLQAAAAALRAQIEVADPRARG